MSYNANLTQRIGITLRARFSLYELKNGITPEKLSDIMDGNEIPIDPVTQNPFQLTKGKIFSNGKRPLTPEATPSSPIDGKTVF